MKLRFGLWYLIGTEDWDWEWVQAALFQTDLTEPSQVIKVPKQSVRILDFQFLSNTRIACSSMRSVTINGRLGPCIDIYDVPSDSNIPIAQDIFVHRLPDIPLVASFQLPLLADRHQGCIWTRPESRTSVSDFYMRIGQPCESTAICDQLVTFGLYGEYRATGESFQGVVSISRLEDILMRKSEARGINIPTSFQISWNHWSSAVSLQKIKSSALVPKPNNTLIARLCRSSNDASHAVMVIRDYN